MPLGEPIASAKARTKRVCHASVIGVFILTAILTQEVSSYF